MKNNEIKISAIFEHGDKSEELSFLVYNDITLKALIQGIYYGLNKTEKHKNSFMLMDKYLRNRKEILIKYRYIPKGSTNQNNRENVIDCTDIVDGKPVFDIPINKLGIVTSSCLLFTMDTEVVIEDLFSITTSYFVKQETPKYNISTRRLNVIEPSVIEILQPEEMPQNSTNSFWDVIIPTLLSTGTMIAARFLIMKLIPSASGMGNTMLFMTGATAVVSFVTTTYNYLKQKRDYAGDVNEWKANYEKYIHAKIKTIKEWQKNDIKYLKSVYPDMGKLFQKTAKIDGSIFSRSQNDNDFMMLSLGNSEKVKPLFEIKGEKKDAISYDIRYKYRQDRENGDTIEIVLPPEKTKKNKNGHVQEESEKERRDLPLLTDLAYNFAHMGTSSEDNSKIFGFNYLKSGGNDEENPPLLLDLKSCGVLGVIDNDATTKISGTAYDFVRHLVFDLAYYHSPEDLQFVFFFNEEGNVNEQNELIKNYNYLPHTNELLDGISQFVFDKESAGVVFGQLLSIMNQRTKARADNSDSDSVPEAMTQIVCVVFNDYNIKEAGFSKYLPEAPKEGEPYVNKNGLTFIFIQPCKEMLPKYCGSIVEISGDDDKKRKVSLRYNVLSREILNLLAKTDGSQIGTNNNQGNTDSTDDIIEYKPFTNDYIFKCKKTTNVIGREMKIDEAFTQAFRQLSAIYYTRIAENGKVPSMVTLFELYKDRLKNSTFAEIISENWNNETNEYDVTKNLRVPIGMNDHGALYLDLYEKADGPHMLVAGTTGSGKSETIITYLIGLCMKFSPMDLNLMLVDMKGGGFSNRLGDLPHCVGAVTDTAGEEEGTSAAYMLKRFLESLNAEIKRRKLLLSSLDVDNVDSYIRALRTIRKIKDLESNNGNPEEIKELKNSLNDKQLNALSKNLDDFKPLSHLVLVVDEFTELKRFSSESSDVDFIAEITTIARVGRTLGFHIILVSQNIEGAITDDIRVNSKARICLKVATKQASKEMIDSPVAAAPAMPLNGRAYLLVGTGTRFEYFQSAYTGANNNTNIEKPVSITEVPNSGKYNSEFYDNEIQKKKNKNIKEHDTQLAFAVNTIIQLGKKVDRPGRIFLPPLPGKISDQTEWEGL